MFLTKKHLSRRTFLRGPASASRCRCSSRWCPPVPRSRDRRGAEDRLGCIYIPHGATMDKWTPKGEGTAFEFSEILQPLAPFRDRVMRRQRSGARAGRALDRRGHRRRREPRARGRGVPERRAPGQEERSARRGDHRSGRRAAGRPGHAAAVDRTVDGAAEPHLRDAGFTCAYRNTLSWKSATLPLPMENNPQIVFERLFGDGSTDAQRQERRQQSQSLLDSIGRSRRSKRICRPRDRRRLRDYLDEVREIERRVKQVDAQLSRQPRAAGRAGRHSRRRSRSI